MSKNIETHDMTSKRTSSKRSSVKRSAVGRRMVLSTSMVADDNREKTLVHGGETVVQKLGCLFSNWSWSRFSVRLGQYQTSGEGDDDYADGDEKEPDDETGNASSSSIGAVVLEVAIRQRTKRFMSRLQTLCRTIFHRSRKM
ncbi:hypothetical protein QTP88_019025 [Uroleucon formosanum]